MPAAKARRQSVKNSQRNGSVRTATRTSIGKALRSVEGGDVDAATTSVGDAIRSIDLAVRKGLMHRNAAARRKSRISARLNKLQNA
ncbi:MAG: 30S ribosomal protein S20 [SAR202 cluster bacterium Io17-Chloro-G4]|nr:MAG: 30S ribosomal protein S20 [SAR202 cluster bacterium Io17-Chloro-G4]